jgi:mannose/fructose/N-acetylgalactosamine-specific phosphotransferase system component IID
VAEKRKKWGERGGYSGKDCLRVKVPLMGPKADTGDHIKWMNTQ